MIRLLTLIVWSTLTALSLGQAVDIPTSIATEVCPALPQLRLAGTTVSNGTAPAQAFIEEVDNGQQHLLDLNATIGSFRLAVVSPDGAVLTGNGCAGEITLTLNLAKASGLSQVVEFEGAKSSHIVTVEPRSILNTLGIKPGDTLKAINGQNVEDSKNAYAALSRLDDRHLESIAVMRDGRLTVFVNPASDTVRNFKPPPPMDPDSEAGRAAAQALTGSASLREREDR